MTDFQVETDELHRRSSQRLQISSEFAAAHVSAPSVTTGPALSAMPGALGAAADGFNDIFAQWTEMLGQFSRRLESIATNYDANEQNASAASDQFFGGI